MVQSLDFYIKDRIQLTIRVVMISKKPYYFFSLEEISDKVYLGEANSKLKYSMLLLNTISHELFTPLHHIIGFTDRILKKVDSVSKPKKEPSRQDSNKKVTVSTDGIADDVLLVKQIANGLKLLV